MARTAATASRSLPLKPSPNPRIIRPDLPLLQAIISGGQTGSDAAGLRAAARLGLATGGHAPRGWRTQDGPAPWLGTEYGLVEHWSTDYAPRTASNVHDSDATVRIAADFDSPGERCTLRAILKYGKPHHDVHADRLGWGGIDDWDDFRKFLIHHNVRILNVAGNSESRSPGIGRVAEAFLVRALSVSP